MRHTKSTRRGFLITSASIVTGGAAVPYFWTSSCAKAESKNDRPIVALIGAGLPTSWGSSYRRWRSQGRGTFLGQQAARFGDMVACCDVDRTHAESFVAHHGGGRYRQPSPQPAATTGSAKSTRISASCWTGKTLTR